MILSLIEWAMAQAVSACYARSPLNRDGLAEPAAQLSTRSHSAQDRGSWKQVASNTSAQVWRTCKHAVKTTCATRRVLDQTIKVTSFLLNGQLAGSFVQSNRLMGCGTKSLRPHSGFESGKSIALKERLWRGRRPVAQDTTMTPLRCIARGDAVVIVHRSRSNN